MGFFQDLKEDLSQAANELAEQNFPGGGKSEMDIFAAAEASMGIEHLDETVEIDTADVEAVLDSFLDKIASNAEEQDAAFTKAAENYDFELSEVASEDTVEDLKEAVKALEFEVSDGEIPSSLDMNVDYSQENKVEFSSEDTNDTSEEVVDEKIEEDFKESFEETEQEVFEETKETPEEVEEIERPRFVYTPVKEEGPEPKYFQPTPTLERIEEPIKVSIREEASEEIGVITKGMVVKGDIISSGALDVFGGLDGNIRISGQLSVTGVVTGNSEASAIAVEGAEINGDLISEGAVQIGRGSVVRGNISGTSALISGAVKGDIDIHGPVVLESTAIVMGNIKSKTFQISNGAAIEGMCSQCYAEVSPSAFFSE